MKIAINVCVGGFSLSKMATEKLALLGNKDAQEHIDIYKDKSRWFSFRDIERNDPLLIRVLEDMGEAANGTCAEIKIVEIPDGVLWEVCSQDEGVEWIAEKHRTWN